MSDFATQSIAVANNNAQRFARRWLALAEVIEEIREHHAWVTDVLPKEHYCLCGLMNCPDAALLETVKPTDLEAARAVVDSWPADPSPSGSGSSPTHEGGVGS